jgi:hypothetical protein
MTIFSDWLSNAWNTAKIASGKAGNLFGKAATGLDNFT